MARVIAVTGSTGFVGSQLVRHLLDLGHEVVGLDRRVPQWGAERFAHVAAELRCPDGDVRAVLGSAEAVVHLAACPGVRDAGPDVAERRRRDNVEATDAVLALTPATTPTVVTSSSSVYGGTVDGRASHEDDVLRPVGGYAESKALVERRCAQRRDEGGHVTVVRPFTVVGPGQRPDMALSRWIEQARRGQPLEVYGSLDRRRDVTDVRDVARALAALIEVPPSTVNLGTGIVADAGRAGGRGAPGVRRHRPGRGGATRGGAGRHLRRHAPLARPRRLHTRDRCRRRGGGPGRASGDCGLIAPPGPVVGSPARPQAHAAQATSTADQAVVRIQEVTVVVRPSGSTPRATWTNGSIVRSKSTIERVPAGQHAEDEESVGRHADGAGRGQEPASRGAEPIGPPRDGQHGEGDHDDHLAARPPPAVHGEGDEGGVEPSSRQHGEEQHAARRPPAGQGGRGGHDRECRRLPEGETEAVIDEQTHEPPAPDRGSAGAGRSP